MQNKLARDAAAARESQLEAEVETLRERAAAASAAAAAATPRAAADAEAARRELNVAQQAIAELEASVSEVKATNDRLGREKRALQEQIEAMAAKGGGAASAEAVENLRRALDAQRERDSVSQEAESLRRQFSRHRLESSVRAQQLEGQVEGFRAQLAALTVRCWTSMVSQYQWRYDLAFLRC
jgi:predicted  nucleic acid-binding Zn-ribbon protein